MTLVAALASCQTALLVLAQGRTQDKYQAAAVLDTATRQDTGLNTGCATSCVVTARWSLCSWRLSLPRGRQSWRWPTPSTMQRRQPLLTSLRQPPGKGSWTGRSQRCVLCGSNICIHVASAATSLHDNSLPDQRLPGQQQGCHQTVHACMCTKRDPAGIA